MSQSVSFSANNKRPFMRPKESDMSGDTTITADQLGIGGSSNSLPPGAMPASLPLPFHTNVESPPTTPSQKLLEPEYIQYAGYAQQQEKPTPLSYPPGITSTDTKIIYDPTWVPLPLRRRFWVPFVVLLAAGAIALEIALHFSNKNNGWRSRGSLEDQSNVLHYVYTLPPVAVAAFLVALWAWTDIEIKKMQPYVDLVHGDSPPHRSLLLDYTRTNNFIVWARAATNKHYLVALASLMVLISLAFQPLAAALLVVKDVYWTEPDFTVNNVNILGLNNAIQTTDLTSYLTASGYAGASILYGIGPPPFVNAPYTIAQFDLPALRSYVGNGTIFANTTAVKSDAKCESVSVQMVQHADGTGWTNSVNSNNCTISWEVDKNSTTLFGTDTPTCNPPVDPFFSPVIFWIFTYQPSARASATFCFPSFALWDVTAEVDIATGNLTSVTKLKPFSTVTSNFSQSAGTLIGPPLNGNAFNGIKFNLTNPDRFALARENATQLQMPAAIYQAALAQEGELLAAFEEDRFATLADNIYALYLSLIARAVYFIPTPQNGDPITLQVKTFKKRVMLSPTAVHLLAAGLLILAVFGTIVHLLHRDERRQLKLKHQPGTIASAVSIGAQTGVGQVLAGRQAEKEISEILRNKKFRIDPTTMKIVMEGEDGYEVATSPGYRRRSFFHRQREGDRSLSRGPATPKTPRSPLNDSL